MKRNSVAFVLAVASLKGLEAFSELPYLDVGGQKTIGYGHLMRAGDPEFVTPYSAEKILKTDAEKAFDCVEKNVPVATDNKKAALIMLVFNIGCAAFEKSTLLKYLRQGRSLEEIHAQWVRWVYVGKTVVPGLVNRRYYEWKVYTS